MEARAALGREDLAQHAAELAGRLRSTQLIVGEIGRRVVHRHDLVLFLLLEVAQARGDGVVAVPEIQSRRVEVTPRNLCADEIRQAFGVIGGIGAHCVQDACLLLVRRRRIRRLLLRVERSDRTQHTQQDPKFHIFGF